MQELLVEDPQSKSVAITEKGIKLSQTRLDKYNLSDWEQ